ncbi:hypothetical protein FACS189429_7340 [Bacteroidia bacterium]|nr:hypothetical protein FACS189429_7340 [Bacteroidia bacterium]
MKKILQITAGLLVSASLFAQTGTVPSTVMTNLGILKVAVVNTTDSATIFVGGTFKTKNLSAVDLDGKMIITGNFVQDATRPAFVSPDCADDAAKTDNQSTGVFTFRGDFDGTAGAQHRIHKITTTQTAAQHDRGVQFLAFPNIKFDTNDTVVVTSYMGIDAQTIATNAGKQGKLLLTSTVESGKVYDASLRFPFATGTSVPAGIVAVERNVQLYRSNATDQLVAFAPPFTNQRSGYFAGNWVRNPIINSQGYVLYPLANAMDANGHIYPEYYVIDPFEQLLPGQPYLIRYNNSSFTYDSSRDLLWTGDQTTTEQNTLNTYLFNGHPYNLADVRGYIPEQILTDEPLYSHNLPAQTASTAKYIVIGNSYSAPISVEKLVAKLVASGLQFTKYLYYFPAGGQNYQQMDMSQNVNAFPLQYIPSQGIFMIRHAGAGGQLTIDKTLTEQAKVSHNLVTDAGTGIVGAPALRSVDVVEQPNLLKFRVTPADNENVYDVTAVFVRTDASAGNDKYDMQKYVNGDNGAFHLSMRDDANTRQFQMGVPVTTARANMSFKPTVYGGTFVLTASNVESMTTQAVVLEDTKTNTFQDLRENPVYEFETNASDYENRFVVHFLPQMPTGTPDLAEGAINAYYNTNNAIVVTKLNEKDINSTVEVIDMQGRVIAKDIIKSYPTQNVDATLADGVYIVRVKGARNYTGKVVVK